MTKYKINRDTEPKKPSKAEMDKYKNFNALNANYDKFVKRPKLPLYKDKRVFLALVIIGLIAYLISQNL